MAERHCQLQKGIPEEKALPLLRLLASGRSVRGMPTKQEMSSFGKVTLQARGFGVWENLCHHSGLRGKTGCEVLCAATRNTQYAGGNITAHIENPSGSSYLCASSPAHPLDFRLSLFCTEQLS